MNNQKVRNYAKQKNVCLWEIAHHIGVSEPTITRKMRIELSEAESSKLLKAIDEIAKTKSLSE